MSVLYIASDQQGAGKTAFCAAIAGTLARQGKKAAVLKPFARPVSGSEPDRDVEDYQALLNVTAEGWPLKAPTGALRPRDLEQVRALADKASQGVDLAIAEGSGALDTEESAQIANAMDAKVVVVARYRRDLAVDDLRAWRDALGERLVGFVVNGLTRYLGTATRQGLLSAMDAESLPVLGAIPEDRRLLGVSVSQLAEHLKGRFIIHEDGADALVEHLMVGGLSMDSGALYFGLRKHKAAIIRGDRPDLQMSALNTPTACLVLTKGIEPIEYVRYEAEQEQVPVLVVDTDTVDTMDALGNLIEGARFDHPLKLRRFEELLEEHVDLPLLYGALGLEG